MKIYLIDDDASVCNILKIIIQQKKLGEVCGTASNGMDALEDLRDVSPDIVVVDLLLCRLWTASTLCAKQKNSIRYQLCHASSGEQQGNDQPGI